MIKIREKKVNGDVSVCRDQITPRESKRLVLALVKRVRHSLQTKRVAGRQGGRQAGRHGGDANCLQEEFSSS